MAKLFKGRLPADHREMTIIEVGGAELCRSWDRGQTRRQALKLGSVRALPVGTAYTVRWAVCEEGGRGKVVRDLGSTEGVRHQLDAIPADYR